MMYVRKDRQITYVIQWKGRKYEKTSSEKYIKIQTYKNYLQINEYTNTHLTQKLYL